MGGSWGIEHYKEDISLACGIICACPSRKSKTNRAVAGAQSEPGHVIAAYVETNPGRPTETPTLCGGSREITSAGSEHFRLSH